MCNVILRKGRTCHCIDVINEIFQHEVVPRFLSDKLLEQNRLKNIPPLSTNQQFLIARLVWYQDGYEQPSEEDLKRVTQVSITFFETPSY